MWLSTEQRGKCSMERKRILNVEYEYLKTRELKKRLKEAQETTPTRRLIGAFCYTHKGSKRPHTSVLI